MTASEFIERFRKRKTVLLIWDCSAEDAIFVGKWLNDNFDFPPYRGMDYREYILDRRSKWRFLICQEYKGYCPAGDGDYEIDLGKESIISVHEFREMIEREAKSLEELNSEFDSVF